LGFGKLSGGDGGQRGLLLEEPQRKKERALRVWGKKIILLWRLVIADIRAPSDSSEEAIGGITGGAG